MREVIGLGQLRSDACAYLERVAAGETIDVVRRGKVVARIVSVGDWRVAPIPARSVRGAAPDAGGWVGLDELRTRAGRCFDRVAAGETFMSSVAAGYWRGLCRPVSRGRPRFRRTLIGGSNSTNSESARGAISTGSRPGRR